MNGKIARCAGIVVMLVLVTRGVAAETVSGSARLVDGDTIEVAGQMVRLHGIDAPESGQTCTNNSGRTYRCGEAASRELARLIGGRRLRCSGAERDRYDRLIAVCTAGPVELNRAMVRAGWAVAYQRYSDDYLSEELEATKANRGIWRGGFERPGAHRQREWSSAVRARPDGCPIKGNISSRGRIYHVPWSRYYSRTRIDAAKGERWFCNEAEAIAAGWRAPLR